MILRNITLSAIAGSCLFLSMQALADGILPRPLQVEGLVSYREPYRVEGLTRYRDNDAEPGALEGPFVVVDYGPARLPLLTADEWPDQFATIVGTEGHLQARLHDIVRSCEHPCGPEEFEQCHFSALYRPETPVAAIGTPLIAIEGRHALEDFQPATGRRIPLESLSLAPGLAPTMWSGGSRYGFRDLSGDGRSITLASDRPQLDGIEWQDCLAEDYGTFQHLQCGPANGALLADGLPLLVSVEEGRVSAFATFDARGQTYSVVQSGFNAGILARTDRGWRGSGATARRMLICG